MGLVKRLTMMTPLMLEYSAWAIETARDTSSLLTVTNTSENSPETLSMDSGTGPIVEMVGSQGCGVVVQCMALADVAGEMAMFTLVAGSVAKRTALVSFCMPMVISIPVTGIEVLKMGTAPTHMLF